MNNNKKYLNIALGVTVFTVAASLLASNFLSTEPSKGIISTSTNLVDVKPMILKADTLLSIQAIANSGCDNAIQLNDDKLSALPQQEFVTHHSWSDKAESFKGPLLSDVLNTTCSNTKKIKLTALNDYAVDMDFSKLEKYQPIVAMSVNGKRLSIREKGPLWIMVPLDKYKDIEERSMDGIMIWQLSDIKILKADDNAS